ncbi:MAG: hypothetical protein GY754_06775 [bacterium]|nr:hypothetical protein [bacterium]
MAEYTKHIKIILFTSLFLLVSVPVLMAQTEARQLRSEKELHYTYIGPVAGGGMNFIQYSDWTGTQRENQSISGFHAMGGVVFNIFVNFFIGDFRIYYMHNINDNGTLLHPFYTLSGKYNWQINNFFSLFAGLGCYFESPPSNLDYNGSAGGQLPLGFVLNTTFDTKFFFEAVAYYGVYGMGESSTKFFFGANIGFMFKVGRI